MELKSGNWYFAVRCHSCQKQIVFADAPSSQQQASDLTFANQVRCDCDSYDVYQPDEIMRIQHRQFS